MHLNHLFRTHQYVICIISNKEDIIMIPKQKFTERKALHQFLKFYRLSFKMFEPKKHLKSGSFNQFKYLPISKISVTDSGIEK